MLPLSITTEQKIHIKLAPTTTQGKPAVLDGTPTWEVTQGSGTVSPDADGLGAFIVSPDTVDGIVTIVKVSADADLGAGIRTIEDTIEVTITNAEAAALGLTADAAEPK